MHPSRPTRRDIPLAEPTVRNPQDSLEQVFADQGLTPTEIRTYQFLLEARAATSSQIARETGQPRGRIYDTMRRLVEKGFAREEPTTPIKYTPVPLVEVVSQVAARISQQTRALRDVQIWIQKQQKENEGPPPAPSEVLRSGNVGALSGRRACNAELRKIARQAREFVFLCGNHRFAQRLKSMTDLLGDLQAAQRRDVDVWVLLPSDANHPAEDYPGLAERIGKETLETLPRPVSDCVVTLISELAVLDIIAQPDDESPNRGDDLGIRVEGSVYALARAARLEAMLESSTTPS